MVLTTQQIQEIKDYIFDASKYRETFNEVYDHVLNAIADQHEPYSIELYPKLLTMILMALKELENRNNFISYRLIRNMPGFLD